MSYEHIQVDKQERVNFITINRPDAMNSINPPTSQELDQAFNEFSSDPEAWVCILTGTGEKAFSAGNDLKYQAQYGPEETRKGFARCKGGFGGITASRSGRADNVLKP